MLRITSIDSGNHAVRLLLEGRIAGPWVAELSRVCDHLLTESRVLQLDLAGISFLELDGIRTLAALQSRGVALVNCSPFVVEQLRSGTTN